MNSAIPLKTSLFLKVFLTSLLLLFITLPALSQELKSGGSGNPVAVDFVNGTDGKIGIYWIDFKGGEQYYGDIEPGAFYRQPTGAGHVWRAKSGETEVGIFTATETPEQRHTFEKPVQPAQPKNQPPPKVMPTASEPPAGPVPEGAGKFVHPDKGTPNPNPNQAQPAGPMPIPQSGVQPTFQPKGIPNPNQPQPEGAMPNPQPGAVPPADAKGTTDSPPQPKTNPEAPIGGQDQQKNFRQDPALNRAINPQQPDFDSIHQAIALVTNETRIKNGLAPLPISPQLTAAAKMHADDMVSGDFFDHQNIRTEAKQSPEQRAAMHGIANPSIAENIAQNFAVQYAAGTLISSNTVIPPHTPLTLADALVTQWMNSQGHRQNILSDQAKAIGCGVQVRPAQPFPGIYAVQKYQLTNDIQLIKSQ